MTSGIAPSETGKNWVPVSTAASLAIANGANPLMVQRMLGHKDMQTTLSVYGHLYPEQDATLMDSMEQTYGDSLAAYSRPGVREMRVAT